jgi:hypothetical protein
MENPPAVPDVDISRPHIARIYDYFLGGKNQPPKDPADQPFLNTEWYYVDNDHNKPGCAHARHSRFFIRRALRITLVPARVRT